MRLLGLRKWKKWKNNNLRDYWPPIIGHETQVVEIKITTLVTCFIEKHDGHTLKNNMFASKPLSFTSKRQTLTTALFFVIELA